MREELASLVVKSSSRTVGERAFALSECLYPLDGEIVAVRFSAILLVWFGRCSYILGAPRSMHGLLCSSMIVLFASAKQAPWRNTNTRTCSPVFTHTYNYLRALGLEHFGVCPSKLLGALVDA